MSPSALRLPVLVVSAAVLVLLGLALGVFGSQPLFAQRPAQEGPIPCDPVVTRTIDKRVIKEGEAFNVTVEYNYKCNSTKRRINFVIMVENTPYLRGGDPTPKPLADGAAAPQVGEMLNNVRNGLKQFVNEVEFGNGSEGSFMRYSDDYYPLVPLHGGEQTRDNILKQIQLLNASSDGGASGLAGALRDAVGSLPERTEDATNVVLIVDAGAVLYGTGPKLSELLDSCSIAKDNNVLRIVVGLPAAGNRLARLQGGCADWMYVVSDPNGKDLVGPGGIFDQIAGRLIRGAKAEGALYSDRFNGFLFEFVPGSGKVDGAPDQPAVIAGNEISWDFNDTPPPGGRLLEYQVKAYDDSGEGIGVISNAADLIIKFPGGDQRSLAVPNYEVCVYTTMRPTYCDRFALTLTPPATAATPTEPPPSETPTDPPPTETPTATESATAPPVATETPVSPTATDTPVIERGIVYLPLLLANHPLR